MSLRSIKFQDSSYLVIVYLTGIATDIDNPTFNCDNAYGHSQTRNRIKLESNGKRLEILFTHRQIFNIYLRKLPFTDKKSWIVFQVQLLLTTSAI